MKSQGLQEMINKIFGDDQTRLQFISDPQSVISQFELTQQEKRAVLDLQSYPGLTGLDSAQLEMAVRPNIGWLSPTP
jgi:hypothetical protein